MQSNRISERQKLLWDQGWILNDVCLAYQVKPISFPGFICEISLVLSENQRFLVRVQLLLPMRRGDLPAVIAWLMS